jgi:uncharacterized membrane protein YphA (DoxX/SURF4 family)
MTHLSADDTLHKDNIFKRIVTFSWVKRSLLVEIIALLFVILFLYTGIAKLMEFDVFQEQIGESPVLEPVAPIIAWGLPIIEFTLCVLLFFPRWRLKGLYATFGLMVIFTGYVIALLTTSTELPCSCGGIIQSLSWKMHLALNFILLALAVYAITGSKKHKINKTA